MFIRSMTIYKPRESSRDADAFHDAMLLDQTSNFRYTFVTPSMMLCFWTKLQISGILSSQGKRSPKLLKSSSENPTNNVLLADPRTFFSWIRAAKDKSKEDRRPTVCGKALPDRPQPCNPECASKCLQISGCDDKELAKRRLSNCRDSESNDKPKSYWEIMFGWKPEVAKRPDPRTCRLAYRDKQISRQRDPRLCDPRYEATPGDVLIFTENPRPKVCVSEEPRPKPPPSYKIPKAVATKRITEQAEKAPHDCAAASQFEPSCDSLKCSVPKASILPFEELRPPESQRKIFSCRNGVRPEDVPKPLRRDANSSGTPKNARSFTDTMVSNESDCAEFSMHSARRNSRVEQLKKLTKAGEGR